MEGGAMRTNGGNPVGGSTQSQQGPPLPPVPQQQQVGRYMKQQHPMGGSHGSNHVSGGAASGVDSESENEYGMTEEQQQLQHLAAATNSKRSRKHQQHNDLGSSLRGGTHTPSSTTPDDPDDTDYRSGGPQYANPNLLPPEYYTTNSYSGSNPTEHHYDNRRPTPRRIPASVSSSDNNSDTTYAESGDINSSLRARMQALDNQLAGNPEHLPTEVVQQRISPHHILMGMNGGGPNHGGVNHQDGSGQELIHHHMNHLHHNPSSHPPAVPPNPPYHSSTSPDDGYQQPQNTVLLSHEYLMSGNGIRYPGSTIASTRTGSKSPGALYCTPSPTREYYTHTIGQPQSQEYYYYQQVHQHQPQLVGTLSSTKTSIGAPAPHTTVGHGVGGGFTSLAALPVVRNNLGSRAASLTGRGLSLGGGKSWHRVFSWRCTAIVLAVLCCILTALLAYFATAANLASSAGQCVIQGDEGIITPGEGAALLPPTTRAPYTGYSGSQSTYPSYHSPNQQQPRDQQEQQQQQQQYQLQQRDKQLPSSGGSGMVPLTPNSKTSAPSGSVYGAQDASDGVLDSSTELVKMLNKRYVSVVPPNDFWNVQFEVKQPMLVRINLTVPRSSYLAVYGRRNVPPSITQYDFVQFIKSGRTTRLKRDTSFSSGPVYDKFEHHLSQDNSSFFPSYFSPSSSLPSPFEEQNNSYLSSQYFQPSHHHHQIHHKRSHNHHKKNHHNKHHPHHHNHRTTHKSRNTKNPHHGGHPHASDIKHVFQGSSQHTKTLLEKLAATHEDFPMWLYQNDASKSDDAIQDDESELLDFDAGLDDANKWDYFEGFGEMMSDDPLASQVRVEYPQELRFGSEDLTEEEEPVERLRRYVGGELSLNVSVTHHMNTGTWYMAFYNDALAQTQIALVLEEAGELPSTCPNDCSGRGSCVLGRCECNQGWVGHDCATSVCPVLCSSHGQYGGGVCHCDHGWKGRECDVPDTDCEVPDCGGRGACYGGKCHCSPGWKGEHCEQVDCMDPTCSSHGGCVDGQCVCRAGWTGVNCSQVDHKVFTCLPDCSGHGHYDLHSSKCVCESFWTGDNCNQPWRCDVSCVHGSCGSAGCICDSGWTGEKCDQKACDPRCAHHGQCHNGTCVCIQGWNGRHCTIPGCVSSCSGHGLCTTQEGEYKCECSSGWTGRDCSIQLETECGDHIDNDGDGLTDCSDSDCCWTGACSDHVMCMVSTDPVEVLLRRQPMAVTASFYQRVKFLVEDRNVQSFARESVFHENRVSVIRGRVVSGRDEGIVGVRTSVDKESKYGLTATRSGGWFDILVNGGGAVTLMFQRAKFEAKTVTVPLIWNDIVVLDPIVLTLKTQAEDDKPTSPLLSQWSAPCLDHDQRIMKAQVVSTHLPHSIGGAPQKPVIFTEMQVVQESLRIPGTKLHLLYHSNSVSGYHSRLLLQLTPNVIPETLLRVHLKITLEGTIFEKLFEADPNISYTYTWNKRNVYKSKMYDVSTARVSVGYEYTSCSSIVWTTQTASMHGFHMAISDVGGWNLDIHHMYNFETGVLQRGDGSLIELRRAPRLVSTAAGTGNKRAFDCLHCEGTAKDTELLAPTALAAAPDGSVYVGDFNLIRRITPDGKIHTVLQLSPTEISYEYYMAVSPSDGQLYVSDAENYRVIRVLTLTDIYDPSANFEVVAGSDHRCIPGDEEKCGDGGPAIGAKLSHPKGLAIAADRTIYIADGPNLRVVDPDGKIHTLIGHHGHKTKWRQMPCSGVVSAPDIDLQWPTHLAISPLDGTLHLLDDHVLMQVTKDGRVVVRAGTPMHCPTNGLPHIGTVSSMSFSPYGSLYLTERSSSGSYSVLELSTADEVRHFAGARDATQQTGRNVSLLLANTMQFGSVSSLAVTPDGVVYIADLQALKVFKLSSYLPEDDHNGDYLVAHPTTNEIYVFNRHGHHIETRDLITGQVVYYFTYSKNTSVGRLSQVTDAAGNKVVFFRDYRSAVSHIENSLGEKFPVHIGRLGLMTQFSGRAGRAQDFTYDEDTGLLVSKTSPGLLTTVYEYDVAGRVTAVIAPTGSRTSVQSWMGDIEGSPSKLLTIGVVSASGSAGTGEVTALAGGVQEEDAAAQDSVMGGLGDILSLTQDGGAYFRHGPVSAEVHTSINGSWTHVLPWGGVRRALPATRSPLLEAALSSQAGLLGVPGTFLLSTGPEAAPFSMTVETALRKTGEWNVLENKYKVNGSEVMSTRWNGRTKTSVMSGSDGQQLMTTHYNNHLKPTSLELNSGLTALNLTYDAYGRVGSLVWSQEALHYSYDENNLLSSIKNAQGNSISYIFNEQRMLSSVKLPSGRAWVYQYDDHGGLKSIMMPSGSSHQFSLQPIFNTFIFKYTSPGSSHAYRQHLDPQGKLLLTAFPDTVSKILYRYLPSGQLDKMVSGDGSTSFSYGVDGLLTEVVNEEENLEYKMDNLYNGKLLSEHRIEFSARSGLSNIKFTYEYDSNMRITKTAGRIGGQKVKPLHISYSPKTGEPTNIANFLIARPQPNVTTVQDGTAIFTRNTDSHMRVTYITLNIHNMQVFTQRISYDENNRISQTSTYTTSYLARPYTYTKDYTYDEDGQLLSVSGKEPWSFSYDMNGNMISLTYSTNTIAMQYDEEDKIIRFGEGVYKYNSRGFIIQNAREVSYEYNARGLLIKAGKPERFTINYYYDYEKRLIARKDNFGNVTQFQYQDPRHPDRVTHIYNARDASLISLLYDDRGHLIFAQVQRSQYYIATDANGTPTVILNRFGELVRQIMSSPYGTVIYDSNPYIYIPIGYCGGILDSQTELVHMPGGRVYDPLIGLWHTPQWENIPQSLMRPERLSLYRPNGNDPVNVGAHTWDNYGKFDWLNLLKFDLVGLAPHLSWASSDSSPTLTHPVVESQPRALWDSFTLTPSSLRSRTNWSPFTGFVPDSGLCVSGLAELLSQSLSSSLSLESVKSSAIREDFWPSEHQVELSSVPGPFGEGMLVSRSPQGKALIIAAPHANPIFRDVITSVFNNSYLIDLSLYSRSLYAFYFVKDDLWRAKDDRNQLNRLAGEVNITQTSDDGNDKFIEVKLHTKYAVVHIRYGTSPRQEIKRLLKHAKKLTMRRAWEEERARVSRGESGGVSWSHDQSVELLTHGSVADYTARYLHPPDIYPELVDDPSNIKFVKSNKRMGREIPR